MSSRNYAFLEKRDGMTKLIVDGRPFICVAGELANSSSTDVETMKAAWPRLAADESQHHPDRRSPGISSSRRKANLTSAMMDYQIEAARANHLRLIFLWMGKLEKRHVHLSAALGEGQPGPLPARGQCRRPHRVEVLSTLGQASRDADAKAFAAVMKHIRQVDSKDHTVIAMQVENEVGLIGSLARPLPRRQCSLRRAGPRELTDYLQQHKDDLLPELKKIWVAAGGKTSGTWEEVFGKNIPSPDRPEIRRRTPGRPAGAELYNHTDEIFMAWNYSRYIGYVAAQGKKEYPLPMYVNAWLVDPGDHGPGDYPSGGPEPLVHDIWRAGAPAIDILAPDIYQPRLCRNHADLRPQRQPGLQPRNPAGMRTIAGWPSRNSMPCASRTWALTTSTIGSRTAPLRAWSASSARSPARLPKPRANRTPSS